MVWGHLIALCVCLCLCVCRSVCVKLDIKIARILASRKSLCINYNVLFSEKKNQTMKYIVYSLG